MMKPLMSLLSGLMETMSVRIKLGGVCLVVFGFLGLPMSAGASPFGWGVFGADVPFGSATSLSISLGGDVVIPLSVNGANFEGSASNTVTVTSTDVVGYYLYAHTTGSSDMTNGSASIAASANATAAALAVDTWGYNTTGSTTNFLGLGSTSSLLKDAAGPYKNGDVTTVTYGVKAGPTQAAGSYSVPITYTAVAKGQ